LFSKPTSFEWLTKEAFSFSNFDANDRAYVEVEKEKVSS
jgi:hypothetical protein